MSAPRRFLILGNPENRRVGLFQESLSRLGRPPARVVGWLDFLRDPSTLGAVDDGPWFFRIDSAGENFEVERELLRWGAADAARAGCSKLTLGQVARLTEDRGRVIGPRQAHLGFLGALKEISRQLVRRPQWLCLNPPREIAELFDKRITSKRFAQAGIPVPESLGTVESVNALRRKMREHHWSTVFVKVSCSSSASCLAVFRSGPRGESLHTTLEQGPRRWYNTLKVRRVARSEKCEQLLAFLLSEGAQVERAVPKGRLDGAFFDCRVLCVAQRPTFVVVRQNRHPITNLHLGGWRGDVGSLKRWLEPKAWACALRSCEKVASMYRALHLGLDVMFEPDARSHRVIEANAFGDLLPGLSHRGRSVYECEVLRAQKYRDIET